MPCLLSQVAEPGASRRAVSEPPSAARPHAPASSEDHPARAYLAAVSPLSAQLRGRSRGGQW